MNWESSLDDATLEAYAGHGAFRRGMKYYGEGRVQILAASDSRVSATVDGTSVYRVELTRSAKGTGWDCTCPAAADGSFCKHCVAVAAELLEGRGAEGTGDAARSSTRGRPAPRSVRARTPRVTATDLRAHVEGLDQKRLVDLVIDRADTDAGFRRLLVDEVRATRGMGPDVDAWKARLDFAFGPVGDFVDYREAREWASGVHDALSELSALCDAGHADGAIELAEYAFELAEAAIQYVDDSDGWITSIAADIGEVHYRACSEHRPDPVEFAGRLLRLELRSELDTFHHAAATYAEVLGERGLAEFHRLLVPRWEQNPTRTEAMSDGTWTESYGISEAMIGWALGTDDPDALIDVRSRDLWTAGDYLSIVRSLIGAGRSEEALNWARLGLVEAPAHGIDQLREIAIELLERPDSGLAADDARSQIEQVRWDAFEQQPSRTRYLDLCALDPGRDADFLERCTTYLREQIEAGDPAGADSPAWVRAWPQALPLIEILVAADDVEAAWEVAMRYGCTEPVRLDLAERRESTAPGDSIDVYEPQVFVAIDTRKNDGYRRAVELMARIERLAPIAGEPERWERILDRVRTEHRAKRNLRKLLEQRGWWD